MTKTKDFTWKVKEAQKVLKAAFDKWPKDIALAWTGGKDSTVLLNMIRELNNGKVPCPVMFIDHSLHFPETIEFAEKLAKDWNLDLITVKPRKALAKLAKEKNPEKRGEISRMGKIEAVDKAVKTYGWRALVVGIRWDEHSARASEQYLSKRENHWRVHPILHFTEKDIWNYIKKLGVPYNPLYDQGYRSLGEKEFTKPTKDKEAPERRGREADKEKIMQRLRALGYF